MTTLIPNTTTTPSTRRAASLALLALAISTLACATGGGKQAEADMTELGKQITEDPRGDCEAGLKTAASQRKNGSSRVLFQKRESKAFSNLTYYAAARCERQADALARYGVYVEAVAKLNAIERILPERFPKEASRSSFAASHITARGKREKWAPLAEAQQKQFDEASAAYKALDPRTTPALAYYKHLELMRQAPPTMADADRLVAEHQALLTGLNNNRALAYAATSPDNDARTQDILKRHKAAVANNKDLVLVDEAGGPYAILSARFGKPEASNGRAQATLSQRYVTGKKTVKNDRYFSAKDKIARLQKEYAWQSKTYNNIKCTKGSSKPQTCARSYYQKMQSLQKDIQREQGNLRDGPTKVVTMYANFDYPVDKPYREIKLPVEVTIRWPGAPSKKPVVLKDMASIRGSATIHKAYPKYGVGAANVPIPSDEKIMESVHSAAAGMLINAANKVRLDRAQQPPPTNMTPAQTIDHWLMTYCVRAGLSLYKERERAWSGLPAAAREHLGKNTYSCDMDDFYSPMNGRRPNKPLAVVELVHARDAARARDEGKRAKKR